MAMYLHLKEITSSGNFLFQTFDKSLDVEVKKLENGVIDAIFSSPYEMHAKDVLKKVIESFEEDSYFGKLKGINFEINKVKYRVNRQNLDFDLMLRHYWKNNGTKSPAIYV